MTFVRFTAASAFVLGLVASSFGCTTTPGKTCQQEGGIVVNGMCEQKCDPSKCLAGNTCVGNRCELICKAQTDCVQGEQCNSVTADDKSSVSVCQYTQKQQDIGMACPNGNECDSSMACPDGSDCGPNAKNPTCSGAKCRPLTCIGSGVGDGNAYCANVDCSKDTDCVGGMYCTVRRLAEGVCGTMIGGNEPKCTADSDCKLPNASCQTVPNSMPATKGCCLDPSHFTDDGATFQKGTITLLRNVCRKRPTCAPCTKDTDCSYISGGACISANGTNYCAAPCNSDTDCPTDHSCASGFCVPKFMGGSCTGTGKFCEPCNTDLDCGGSGQYGACESPTGDQHACIDASYGTACTSSAQCPMSPSGKHGYCLDEAVGVQSTDPIYHHCSYPLVNVKDPSTGQVVGTLSQCW